MNDSQATAGSDSSQFGPTRNPQSPAGQNLSNTATNLQTSTPNLFTGNNSISISSVGDSSFSPYTPDNTTQASVAVVTKPAKHNYPIIIGSGILIVVILVVSWLMIRRQSSY